MKKIVLLLLALFIIPINTLAKSELSLKCDKYTFKEYEDFTCRTSIDTDFVFNQVILEIDLSKNISLYEVRSNYTSLWSVNIEKNIITAETKNKFLVSGLQEFGIILLDALEYGEQTIGLKNIKLINSTDDKSETINDVEQKIKITSSENRLKELRIDSKKINKFNSDIYSYTIEVDNKTTNINIDAELVDKNSKIAGIGEIDIPLKNQLTIVPITVTSESGVNKIYRLYFVRKDITPLIIKASDIILKDNKNNIIDFNFNPDIYEYNIEIDSKITSINFNTLLDDSNYDLVKNYGNRTITIDDGDNIVLIKIKNKDDEEKTYIFNITKLLSNKSENYYLKSLSIDKYDLKFNKRVRNYNLSIKKSTKKLNITALAEDPKSVVNISGNDNLTEGSIIKITVKAENESKFTYQIQISYQKSNILSHLFLIITLVISLGIINEVFKKQKNNKIQKQKSNTIIKVQKPTSQKKSNKPVSKEVTIKNKSKTVTKKKSPETKTQSNIDKNIKKKAGTIDSTKKEKTNVNSNTKNTKKKQTSSAKTTTQKNNINKNKQQNKPKPKSKKNMPKKKTKKK